MAHNPFLRAFQSGLEQACCDVEALGTLSELEEVLERGPDILLIHWAEGIFSEARSRWQILGNIRRLLRALDHKPVKTRVVWLVHNLNPHDARLFQKLVWPRYVAGLARRVDGFMTLAPGTLSVVQDALPSLAGKPNRGLWHPAYPNAELTHEERVTARADLGVNAEQYLFGYCGQIRPYKGVTELLDRFLETDDPSFRLLLAGRPLDNRPGAVAFLDELKAKGRRDPRVILRFGNLSEDAFRAAQGACDMIVAPFRRYLHSGSLVHALSAARPVLTPRTPFAESYQALLGATWLTLYEGPLRSNLLTRMPDTTHQAPNLETLSGAHVGDEARAFFDSIKAQA